MSVCERDRQPGTDLAVVESAEPGAIVAVRHAIDELKAFRTFVANELKPEMDYGIIPGTKKNTLLQPGAQKIAMYFNAFPDSTVEATELGNGHVEYRVVTRLVHRQTGRVIGQGIASCSTMESRYRFREASRKCPMCGAHAIIVGKAEYGGGYLCFKKKDGCGAKFREDDARITEQPAGKVENDNIHDVRNTALKMAVKRSLVAGAMALGCASELFTQDLEDTFDIRDRPQAQTAPGPATESDPTKPARAPAGGPAPAKREAWAEMPLATFLRTFVRARNKTWQDQWAERGYDPATVGVPIGEDDTTEAVYESAAEAGEVRPSRASLKPVDQIKALEPIWQRDPHAVKGWADAYRDEQWAKFTADIQGDPVEGADADQPAQDVAAPAAPDTGGD